MRAASRAKVREVSTISAAITQRGGFFDSADAGCTRNLVLRVPVNSLPSPSRTPICDSRPASSDWWMESGEGSLPSADQFQPRSATTWLSWRIRSCHSRTRM